MTMDGLVGTLTNKQKLNDILSVFPSDGMDHAFGYGSGVFVQEETEEEGTNDNSKQNNKVNSNSNIGAMVDIILSVSDSTAWHRTNLKRNSNHYAALPRTFGPAFISTIQNHGAGCYFNPMVQIPTQAGSATEFEARRIERLVKYGVISTSTLKDDLMHWESMYIAGRMHKPVLHLELPSKTSSTTSSMSGDEILELQQEYNLRYALSTGLLLLPHRNNNNIKSSYSSSTFHDDTINQNEKYQYHLSHLFECIAGMSYINDPRIAAGAEDPKKVQKLVNSSGQFQRFHSMYKHQLSDLESIGLISVVNMNTNKNKNTKATSANNKDCDKDGSGRGSSDAYNGSVAEIEINLNDTSVRKELYKNLPKNVQHHISSSNINSNITGESSNEDTMAFARDLTMALGKIVGPPARLQSAKGIISAGIFKSVQYASSKLTKGIFRNVKV